MSAWKLSLQIYCLHLRWGRRFRLPSPLAGASCFSFAIPLLLALATAHQSRAVCLIRGIVLDADSGKPLPKAKVFAKPRPDTAKPSILHSSDQQGAFCFEHLEPGEYEVVADRPGYLSALYGARPGGEQGMLLTVDGQTELPPLTLKLTRSAAIAGTVLDANGEPREGAHVELDRKAWDKGWNPEWVGFRDTDDRGSFRFPLLAPGTYYVNVKPEGGDGRQVLDEKGQPIRTAEALTYYNGSLTFARATPIPLTAGQEIANLLVTVDRVTPRHASGRLSSSVQLEPPGKLYFNSDTGSGAETSLRQDGTFSVDGLVPGKYRLVARTKPPVATVVDLTNGDVDGIVLEPEQIFEVRFSARVEGQAPPATVQLHALDLDKGHQRIARQEAGGSYLLQSIPPGIYLLEAQQTDRIFVKTLLINGQPKPDAVLDLRKGQPGTIETILSPNVANIEGRLDRPDGALPSLATTVVVMDEAKSRTEVVGDTVTVDHSGKFKLESLAPGKYRVFAIEGFEQGLWGSLELATALREKSLALELHESETKSLAVPVITPEEWTAALRKVGM